jgi:5-hydroxyisourate hydrolase
MAQLSTHVLDTARGLPAANILVEVQIVRGSHRESLSSATTNAQGRTDAPLLAGERLEPGIYELSFHVGDYFRRAGFTLSDPPFLDRVVIRIGVADPAGHYHVPLLISPYGYSTYRGT